MVRKKGRKSTIPASTSNEQQSSQSGSGNLQRGSQELLPNLLQSGDNVRSTSRDQVEVQAQLPEQGHGGGRVRDFDQDLGVYNDHVEGERGQEDGTSRGQPQTPGTYSETGGRVQDGGKDQSQTPGAYLVLGERGRGQEVGRGRGQLQTPGAITGIEGIGRGHEVGRGRGQPQTSGAFPEHGGRGRVQEVGKGRGQPQTPGALRELGGRGRGQEVGRGRGQPQTPGGYSGIGGIGRGQEVGRGRGQPQTPGAFLEHGGRGRGQEGGSGRGQQQTPGAYSRIGERGEVQKDDGDKGQHQTPEGYPNFEGKKIDQDDGKGREEGRASEQIGGSSQMQEFIQTLRPGDDLDRSHQPLLELGHQGPSQIQQDTQVSCGAGELGTSGILETVKRAVPGKSGRRILVESNHLQLNLGTLETAVHYNVNVEPKNHTKKFLPYVMELFRQAHYPKRFPAFDGRENLYSSSMLPFGTYIEDEIVISENDRQMKYKVTIKFAKNVDLRPMQNMMNVVTPSEAIQCIDIVLRSAPASTYISMGRNFYVKPPKIIQLGDGMEMYHGFFQSAIRGWKPLLNVDVTHKAFPKNISVIDAILEMCDDTNRRDNMSREKLKYPLKDYKKKLFQEFIETLKVIYEIPGQPSSRRVYTVNGIDDPPISKQFRQENGSLLTIAEYFRIAKRCTLKFPNLPTLWVGSKQRKNKILLPVELCTIQEGQAVNKKMTEKQTRSMIKYSATNTTIRKEKIRDALDRSNHNNHPCIREFGFSIANDFEKLDARILEPPSLTYAGNTCITPSKGVWRADNVKFLNVKEIRKWTIVNVDKYEANMEQLAKMIWTSAKKLGISIANPERPFVHILGKHALNDITDYFKTKEGFDVIFVVVPNSSSGPAGPKYASYANVKKAAELNVGCLTQCIKNITVGHIKYDQSSDQTVTNILLKVNSKLNGTNHCLTERPPIMNRPCMIMGADVTHPSPGSIGIPSVAAVTASHDPKAFKYNICWRLQPPKKEIIFDLTNIIMEQLLYFNRSNRCKPERIVFFRDGVSESEFVTVRNAEITAIRNACKKMGDGSYEPKLTFLVVQKRHHTRLFPTNSRDSQDKNLNVPAGTCVDHTITNRFMQDFYLVSHASIQGVAKPTKYCTLWDENDMSNDEIEQLTYFLCHMFTRCNRSVSYPAPTYYAHLAAARAKVYIEGENVDIKNLQGAQASFNILDIIRKEHPMFFV